jgi:hypothetical protein
MAACHKRDSLIADWAFSDARDARDAILISLPSNFPFSRVMIKMASLASPASLAIIELTDRQWLPTADQGGV